ncbi:MAG: YfiR family protein [Cytophagales bacterium]|nr:MAG: YfiR family protein [Cytophagales bacterium]
MRFILTICFFLLGFECLMAQTTQRLYDLNETKAGFLHNFVKHTKWAPTETPFYLTDKIVLGIIGKDPFGTKIERIFQGRPVHGRNWEIKRATKIRQLWGCHVIFVCASEKENFKDILEYCRKHSVLTVSDNIPNFCAAGGIINFTENVANRRLGFEINIEAAKRAKLTLNTNLVRLAVRIVGDN